MCVLKIFTNNYLFQILMKMRCEKKSIQILLWTLKVLLKKDRT